ncbi:TPA: hypothetical protein O7X99_004124 [Salmonella enterica]|uniref:Lipoprotein n=8 Tax=Salmonella enterica TaxID=28901 RepID=A0A3Y5ZLE6_SALSE|nr:hypothetical protein [Salmonella enterica]EBL5841824.1 hypothetical protein [Salmonella enterica subsp. enterica serovar Tennessee]EBW2309627.1 hypothetical protein [Salmonella enterica subsp. enterica serovar Kingston]ECD7398348.1 hypothetical protein [Salmonella enterica subsp. enterica serovar Westhampton]EDK6521929.1 hypothetical protein [Salmonella enterica subsp. enterica serovar Typhimurium]EDV0592782.1 hypothetical protein [Salmonella enterica subsp. enterica serovar Gateshead]EEJ7
MKNLFFIFLLPAMISLSGCVTMMLDDHVNDVHQKGQVITTDKIIGLIKDEKSDKWLLAGEKSNYPVRSLSGSLAKALNSPEFDKRFIYSPRNSITIFYNKNYGAYLFYNVRSLNEQQLRKVQTFAPDIQKRQNTYAFELSFYLSRDDVIAKNATDRIERIDKPFTFEIREEGTAYSKALYPLAVTADIVTSPLQLLALPFVIPKLHQ